VAANISPKQTRRRYKTTKHQMPHCSVCCRLQDLVIEYKEITW